MLATGWIIKEMLRGFVSKFYHWKYIWQTRQPNPSIAPNKPFIHSQFCGCNFIHYIPIMKNKSHASNKKPKFSGVIFLIFQGSWGYLLGRVHDERRKHGEHDHIDNFFRTSNEHQTVCSLAVRTCEQSVRCSCSPYFCPFVRTRLYVSDDINPSVFIRHLG